MERLSCERLCCDAVTQVDEWGVREKRECAWLRCLLLQRQAEIRRFALGLALAKKCQAMM